MEIRVGEYKFRTDQKLGSGSFGTVFAGVENRTGRQVAIKIEPLSEPLSLSFRFVSPAFERSWLNFDGLVCVE
ncbi:hypothetical protein BDY24DRAFT_267371 [Mrakia frigida]|uniref:uncharacterized protein n=1 Tax=Mrakia frigida TaxID=29902 RepID=UPI003FCC24B3